MAVMTVNNKQIVLEKDKAIGARDATLDNIRGLFILVFVAWHTYNRIVIGLGGTGWHHAHLKESIAISWWGFNVIDLAPIVFMMFIGFIIYPSFERKHEMIGKRAYKDHFSKALALNGLFLIGANLGNLGSWTFMNDVASASMFMTIFLTKPFRHNVWIKFAAGAALLILYGVFRVELLTFAGTTRPDLGGGLGAAVGFTGIVLLTAGVAELARKKEYYFAIAVLIMYVIGWITALTISYIAYLDTGVFGPPLETVDPERWANVPIFAWRNYASSSVTLFSPTWMIIGFSKALLIYYILWLGFRYIFKSKRVFGLATIGRNLMFYILIFLPLPLAFEALLRPAAPWVGGIVAGAMVILCLASTLLLDKFKVTFKL